MHVWKHFNIEKNKKKISNYLENNHKVTDKKNHACLLWSTFALYCSNFVSPLDEKFISREIFDATDEKIFSGLISEELSLGST